MRIVSLLPSATEIVCRLGLEGQLVGVTHECDWPVGVRRLPKVTRSLIPREATSREIDVLVRERLRTERALYTLDMAALAELRPDLMVTQALCDVCAVAEAEVRAAACALPGAPQVVNLEPACLADLFECLRLVGAAADCEERAEREIAKLAGRVAAVAERTERIAVRPRVVVLEWIDPPFSSGHWTPELVRLAGGREVVSTAGERSRAMDWREVVAAQPEVLVIACCGFDVSRTLADLPILRGYSGWNKLPCVRTGRVYVVDGSAYFSRPGPRLVDSLEILAHALAPDVHPLPAGLPKAMRVNAAELQPESRPVV
jgi:iron complex transport system substrate-binding protein